MPVAWKTIGDALKLAMQQTSGLDDVRWRWQPSTVRKKTCLDLKRSPVAIVGVDERRRKYDAQADRNDATQVGQRSFTLEVRCKSQYGAPDDDEPKDAADVLAQIATRIRRPSILAALAEAGCALSSVGAITRMDYEVDGREYGLAVMELVFLAADVDRDGDDPFIEHVHGTISVHGPDDSVHTVPFSVEPEQP